MTQICQPHQNALLVSNYASEPNTYNGQHQPFFRLLAGMISRGLGRGVGAFWRALGYLARERDGFGRSFFLFAQFLPKFECVFARERGMRPENGLSKPARVGQRRLGAIPPGGAFLFGHRPANALVSFASRLGRERIVAVFAQPCAPVFRR